LHKVWYTPPTDGKFPPGGIGVDIGVIGIALPLFFAKSKAPFGYFLIPGYNWNIRIVGCLGGIICKDCVTEDGKFDSEKCKGIIESMKAAGYTEDEIDNMKDDFEDCCGKNEADVLKLFYGEETSSGQMLSVSRCQVDKYDPSKDYYVVRVKL
ncbi:MAG: hypothetical protein KAH01_00390, partial [Caldisericia bacterium]|nr:hypothetical protein [Caldisericia bacterium]